MSVQPGTLFRAAAAPAVYRQRFTPKQAGLQWLDCGEHHLAPGSSTATFTLPGRETLLFQWTGQSTVVVDSTEFALDPYDVVYAPLGSSIAIRNQSSEAARLVQCSADAANRHPVHCARFAEISAREDRIRRLARKNVYLMFDVTEPADRLVAGYTFFDTHSRSWPPHNHTDQEEVYFFLRGHGAMEVYESPETMTFVHGVQEGDAVTIPFLNFHPVFSQEEPLEFIWCIAGARYWVGDKNKDFMAGKVASLTT